MEILRTTKELREYRQQIASEFLHTKDFSVGLVPTMGALHDGHLSLIAQSGRRDSHTIVSIFVNPTQFGANEDFGKYPRTLESDLAKCAKSGVSAVFTPSVNELYPNFEGSLDEITLVPPKCMGYVLEGFLRPTHFSGVLQVVLKLFHLSGAHRAYFGKKDAQQLLLLQKMLEDFFIPLEIVPCEIIRDSDGLALSSRNIYLDKSQRERALCIPRTIFLLQEKIAQGSTDTQELENLAQKNLADVCVFYAHFFNHRLERIDTIKKGQSIFLLCVGVGTTRLLDNFWC